MFILVSPVAILGDSLPMVRNEDGSASDPVTVERRPAEKSTGGPLDQLRARYARGELTDEEFERRLERLLETEETEIPERSRRREYEEFET